LQNCSRICFLFITAPRDHPFIILPILIFASGQQVKASLLKAESLPIGYYAVIGVIASAFAIGLPIAFLLDIEPIHGLLLGSAMGATDPSAAGAIFRRIDMPKRLHMLLEGESLFNDGTTVVLFSVVTGLVVENTIFRPFDTLLHFAWAIIVAIPVGMLLGWACAWLLK
jgi:CPA1 family monovalent cation:H+ antiporter